MTAKSNLICYGLGIAVGALTGIGIYKMTSDRVIPNSDRVQEGFIAPNKLEIECRDLDFNGQQETILKVGDKSYLLREVDSKPIISAYEITPAEIVPKE